MTEPLFHLAVVVDDYEMGITHVVRGEDHISNTPRQMLIQEAIGAPTPEYAHLPMVLAPDRSKLSKRRGALPVSDYRAKGYLPTAILNYLALLGWNPGTEKEIFTTAELIAAFDVARVQKHGAIFDDEKLRWFNQEHIRLLPSSIVEQHIATAIGPTIRTLPQFSEERLKRFTPTLLERIATFGDIAVLEAAGDLSYVFEQPVVEVSSCVWKKSTPELTKTHLEHAQRTLEALDPWTTDSIKNALWDYATQNGRGDVLWPLRYSLTGKEKSPDPFSMAFILGKEETLARIRGVLARMG
jgi:glutamyl/glutaminyl-tRNA synthetase